MSADDAMASLAAKIRTLDLTGDEAALFAAILHRARDESEVEGFGFDVGSLGFDTRGSSGFKGSDEELQAFAARRTSFKGTDEELQALVDWLRP